MTRNVEVVSVGNELLIGKTVNTNAQWLAKRITSLGFNVTRVTVVRDVVEEIAEALREAICRSPQFIVTTGGLGPTFDDKTLEAVAEAFGCRLEVNAKALKMVQEKYISYAKKLSSEKLTLTPPRVKMATIPEDAEPLPNPVGTAPAVTIRNDNMTVFALPGVPSEMKAIFDNSLVPVFTHSAGNLSFFEASIHVKGIMESEIAPLISRVMKDNPLVYVKSHPLGSETEPKIELHISTTAKQVETAKKRVGRALTQLTESVDARGGETKTPKSKKR